jgi:hypothetical protein
VKQQPNKQGVRQDYLNSDVGNHPVAALEAGKPLLGMFPEGSVYL